MSTNQVIIFDTSKQQLANPASNLKKFVKKYKQSYKIGLNKDVIQYEKIKKANLFVIAGAKDKFTTPEIDNLKKLVQTGGNLLILSNQGGQQKNRTNINDIIKQFGMTVHSDSVVRTSFYKYFHPKQSYIHNGILNEEITRVINGYPKQTKAKNNNMFMLGGKQDNEEQYQKQAKRLGADFVYVRGCTLDVKLPSRALLSSGPLTYPCNRPICGVYQHKSGGKLLVCGSTEMFFDEYFQSQENAKIIDFFLKYFLTEEVQFDFQKQSQQNPEYAYVPDLAQIADNLKGCFHEGEEIPRDFTAMFETNLFKYDFDHVSETVSLYSQMDVKHQILTLIVPQFETPLLGLVPGVFAPIVRQLHNPTLQLFDLDQQFSQQKVRMAQLTNRCQNKDLQYFVRQSGDILGVADKVKNRGEPKAIIKYVLQQIINFKKMNL